MILHSRMLAPLLSIAAFAIADAAKARSTETPVMAEPIRPAQTAGARLAAVGENRMLLSGSWSFAFAKTEADADKLAPFYRPDFPDAEPTAFKPTPVPSNWAVLGYEEPVYRGFKDDKAGEGFYLHEFTPPRGAETARALLHFDGVWSSAEVWLNGERLGRHDSGFTAFAFDVTGKLRPDAPNRLAVRVRQVTGDYTFDVYDDWTLGGIYRDVWLETMPATRWLDSIVTQTDFDESFHDADLAVRVMVGDRNKGTLPGNYPSPGKPYQLRFTLFDDTGDRIALRELAIPAHTETDRETRLTLRVARPRPWTAETPDLYTLRVDLIEQGKIAHTRTQRVGFREISTAGGVFRINGRAVKLRGVNRHDEHPDVGRATTPAHWLQDIRLMKAANINFIRMAHYPHARGFVELCDELGMYVGQEVSLGGAGRLMYDPSRAGAVLQRTHDTILRDLNSPSIVYWSIGNEDPLTALHLASVKTAKALDPTRPVLLPWRAEEWLPPEVDILAPHYWKPAEYDQLAGRSGRPVISTEYTHAYGDEGLGGLETRWKSLTQHPAGAGAAIWLWADQGIKTPTPKSDRKDDRAPHDDHLRITGEGWDGIVDSYRNPTRDYWEAKAVYAQVYPAADTLPFQPGQPSLLVPIQNDYDFTDLSAVKIAWSLHEDGAELAAGFASIHGPPHAAAPLELPLEKLAKIRAGKTYHARFVFTDAQGSEITRKGVELVPRTPPAPPPAITGKPVVGQHEDGTVSVTVGDARYAFDPRTGLLVSASRNNIPLISDLRPTIWRKLDQNESAIANSRAVRASPDLNLYTPTATGWTIEENAGEVGLAAKIDCRIDDKNRFAAALGYRVSSDGSLAIRYELRPNVEAPWVPVFGLALTSPPGLGQIHWLGLGPLDAYPNKRAAPILGLWGGAAGGPDVVGTKATRWIERRGPSGGLRLTSPGYLHSTASDPDTLLLLGGVLGRPEKGRKADESIPQLETGSGLPFVGSLRIDLAPRD